MSTTRASSTMSTNNSQAGCLDPLESMVDFSEYEQVSYQTSPSISPSATKQQFNTRPVSNTPPTLPSSQPVLNGPSHNYDMYRQQTGIPQGAMANTLAINSANMHLNQYGYNESGFLSGLSPSDDFVDFGATPTRSFNASELDLDFDSPNPEPAFFYPEQTSNEFVDPSAIGGSQNLPAASVLPTQSTTGRLYPGIHQHQAALAKAQAQQKQQQQIIQQQQQRQNAMGAQRQQAQRPRASAGPSDPIVEEKISQLLNSMRQSSVATDSDEGHNVGNAFQAQRARKDEEDMDEDERLLASEEGKKLSSKERRQLRNKVSARAFRSRRKEYIGQLEGEIAQKTTENSDLRSQNRALMEENQRLSDLTRMLLSSPSFSGFLETLSQNPAAPAPAPAQPQQQQVERSVRKDVNPYAAQQQMQNQHIGITMIPEQNIDFSMMDLNTDAYQYQPQVFSVLSMPETILDAEALSGKSHLPPAFHSDEEKVELPVIERSPVPAAPVEPVAEVVDEAFDAEFSLFSSSPAAPVTVSKPEELDISALISSISAKPVQYELVVESSTSDDEVAAAMRRVERLSASLDCMTESLARLAFDL